MIYMGKGMEDPYTDKDGNINGQADRETPK
jgi:hypothetical protein